MPKRYVQATLVATVQDPEGFLVASLVTQHELFIRVGIAITLDFAVRIHPPGRCCDCTHRCPRASSIRVFIALQAAMALKGECDAEEPWVTRSGMIHY